MRACRGWVVARAAIGASVGALAGLLAASVLQFTRDRQDAGHLLVWHGGILLASIVLGMLVAWMADYI